MCSPWIRVTWLLMAWLASTGGAMATPPQAEESTYAVTKRADNPKFYSSMMRLTACKIPGPGVTFILPWAIYPPESIWHKEEGTVILQVIFDQDWCVRKATVVQSSGFYRLDNASLGYLMTLKLAPGKLHITQTDDGQPTARIPFQWKLAKPYNRKDPCTYGAKCVDEGPPPPPPESRDTPPEPNDIWMPGYYVYYPKTGYQWTEGRWEAPRPGFHWTAPHWQQVGSRWAFIPGEWEADK